MLQRKIRNYNQTSSNQEREIDRVIKYIRSCRQAGIDTTITIDKSRNHFILNALEEVLQYRSIGTIEECREAVERQKLKKIIFNLEEDREYDDYICPYSEDVLQQRRKGAKTVTIYKFKHCPNCGQVIDWS